jgi:hypothetical protein
VIPEKLSTDMSIKENSMIFCQKNGYEFAQKHGNEFIHTKSDRKQNNSSDKMTSREFNILYPKRELCRDDK